MNQPEKQPAPDSTRGFRSRLVALAKFVGRALPIAILVIGFVLAGLWQLQSVRMWTLATLVSQNLASAEAVLADPSDDVSAKACTLLLEGASPNEAAHYADLLSDRPEAALECVTAFAAQRSDRHLEEKSYLPEPTLVGTDQRMALALGRRWMSQTFEGDTGQCQRAEFARQALEHAERDPVQPLLFCAISAESEAARDCCVEALGGASRFAELLDDPESLDAYQARMYFPDLVEAAFGFAPAATDQTGDKTGDNTGDKKDEAASGSGSPKNFAAPREHVQDWVVEVGCRLHLEQPSSYDVVIPFVPLIESKECTSGETPWSGLYEPQTWLGLCLDGYRQRRQTHDEAVHETVCHGLHHDVLAQSVEWAQLSLHAALADAARAHGRGDGWDVVDAEQARRRGMRPSIFEHHDRVAQLPKVGDWYVRVRNR